MIILELTAVFALINVLPGLAFVFHFTRGKESIGLFDKLILSVIVSPLFLILVSFLEEAVHIPQNGVTLSINVAVLLIANIVLLVRFFPEKTNYLPRLNWIKVFIYAMFVALVFFRVWPTHSLFTPIVHDPIAITEWLKQLNGSHFTTTEQWYPQGLVLYLNYFATFLPAALPRIVLIGSSAIIAFFPISMFYLCLLSFQRKDRWMVFPLIGFVIAARLALPNELYGTAGKNSMIMAFTAAPLLLYLITNVRSRGEYFAAALLTFAVFTIHYPTGFFLLFTLFFVNLREVVSLRGGKLAVERIRLAGYLTALATVAGLGAVLLFKTLPIYLSFPVGDDGSFYYTIMAVKENGIIQYIYRNFLDEQLQVYRTTPIIMFAASLAAFLVAPGDNKELLKKLLVTYIALYLIGVLVLLSGMTDLGVFYNVEIRFFLVFLMIMMMAWFFHYLFLRVQSKIDFKSAAGGLAVAGLALLFLSNGVDQYRLFKHYGDSLQTVMPADIRAFDFIRGNLGDDQRILVQVGSPLPNNSIIAGADSGAWIPVYTDKKVEVDFLQFTGSRASRIFDLYLALAKNGEDSDAITRLHCDFGIGYVFFGSRPVFFDNMRRANLDSSRYFEKVYDDGAAIYKMKPLSCPPGPPE